MKKNKVTMTEKTPKQIKQWAEIQRREYHNGKMTEKHYNQLKSAGFDFGSAEIYKEKS